MDPYLLKNINEILTQCVLCKKREITVKKCCICNVCYCKKCESHFQKIYGFYENNYCKECYQILHL